MIPVWMSRRVGLLDRYPYPPQLPRWAWPAWWLATRHPRVSRLILRLAGRKTPLDRHREQARWN